MTMSAASMPMCSAQIKMLLYCIVLVAINILQAPFVLTVQCPVGWQLSTIDAAKCYLVVTSKATWFDAEQYCKQTASHLTSITSAFETSILHG